MKKIIMYAIISTMIFGILGCSAIQDSISRNTQQAEEDVDDGNNALADHDLDGAYTEFADALENDPDNQTAQFWYSLLSLYTSLADSEYGSNLELSSLRTSSTGNPLNLLSIPNQHSFDLSTTAINTHPGLRIQTEESITYADGYAFMVDTIFPALEISITMMEALAEDTSVQIYVPSSITGLDYEVEIDSTEIMLLTALLHLADGTLHAAFMYDFDPQDTTINSYGDFKALLDDDSTDFGTLRNGYPTIVRNHILSALSYTESALSFWQAETDDQTDDILAYNADYADTITEVNSAITTANTCITDSTSTFSTEIGSVAIAISIYQLLHNPPSDLESYFPEYTSLPEAIIFPADYDYTLNDIFPDLTKADFQTIIDEQAEDPSLIVLE